MQRLVPATARNILDLGCSTGALGEAIKARQDANVVGVELSESFASSARQRLDRVVATDIEDFVRQPPPAEAPFDCLIAADVLEHLVNPRETLRQAVTMLAPGATVVVSVPNVFYCRTLLRAIAARRWPLEDEGIFDRTHLRWFGPADARDLLLDAGLSSVVVRPEYWFRQRWMGIVRGLEHTPARDFLPAQHLATGVC